jgi:hypothetical protein
MKKSFCWLVFVFMAPIFGCTTTVIRADLPKTFPNVQILMEKLDRKEALEILNKYIVYGPGTGVDSCEINDNGFYYDYWVAINVRNDPTPTGVRRTTTYGLRSGVLYFQEIQRLETAINIQHGDWFFITMPTQSRKVTLQFLKGGRDEVIAALLTLCPNIK